MNMKPLRSIKMLETMHPPEHYHIPEGIFKLVSSAYRSMFTSTLYFLGEKKVTVQTNQNRQLTASVTLVSSAT